MKKSLLAIGLLLVIGSADHALAGTIYTFQTTGTIASKPVAGTAQFDVGTTGLTLTLENTTDGVAYIAQILDGFMWTMNSSPFLTQTSASLLPGGKLVNCNGTTEPCTEVTTLKKYWPLGAQPTPYTVLSGDGFKLLPFGLVDADYTAPGGSGGLSNAKHNPLLVGTLQLQFIYGTLANPITLDRAPSITGTTFVWGTDINDTTTGCLNGDCTPPQVPEPASMLLLGTGLLGAGFAARRRRN